MEKEYKRICGLIRGRDKWQKSQDEAARKMAALEARARNTKAGRTVAKHQVEIETSQRLAAKATAEAKRTIDLVRAGSAAEPEVGCGGADAISVSTASGKVLPLQNVLHRQSQAQDDQETQNSPPGQLPPELGKDVTVASTSLVQGSVANATMNRTGDNLMSMSLSGKAKAKIPKGYVKYDIVSAINDLETAVLDMAGENLRRQRREDRRHKVEAFDHVAVLRRVAFASLHFSGDEESIPSAGEEAWQTRSWVSKMARRFL